MVIDESDSEAEPTADANGAGTAFLAASRGIHGSTRDAKGNLRYNKNTKRAREEEMAMDLDEYIGDGKKEKKRKQVTGRLGEEYRAKVCG